GIPLGDEVGHGAPLAAGILTEQHPTAVDHVRAVRLSRVERRIEVHEVVLDDDVERAASLGRSGRRLGGWLGSRGRLAGRGWLRGGGRRAGGARGWRGRLGSFGRLGGLGRRARVGRLLGWRLRWRTRFEQRHARERRGAQPEQLQDLSAIHGPPLLLWLHVGGAPCWRPGRGSGRATPSVGGATRQESCFTTAYRRQHAWLPICDWSMPHPWGGKSTRRKDSWRM